MWQPKLVLGISAHADDLELGAGGTINKWRSAGAVVRHVILSTHGQKVLREPEIYAANEVLGIPKESVLIYDFPNRKFDEHRQAILQVLWDVLIFKPDVVLIPSSFDTHQDHEVVHKESLRAFRNRTLLGYEDPWNMYESGLRLSVALGEKHIGAKVRAVAEYKTQADRVFVDQKFLIALAMTRGMTVRKQYAENFEVIRWVL
jgi:LmbE family N-acetylglucosaminyl deacetylase